MSAWAWIRRERETALVYFFVLAGFLLRLSGWFLLPIPPEAGDQHWYLDVARNLLAHGIASEDKVAPFRLALGRPPGFPLFLSPFLAIWGESYRIPVMTALSAAGATSVLLSARITRLLLPETRWASAFAAAVVAISPHDVQLARYIMTESVLTPSFLLFTWLCLRAVLRGGRLAWFEAIVLGILGAWLVFLRIDSMLLVAGPIFFSLVYLVATRQFGASVFARWVMVGVVTIAVCVPYSVYATRRSGSFVFVAKAEAMGLENGVNHWMALSFLPEPEWWARVYAYPEGRLVTFPDSYFDSAADAEQAAGLLRAAAESGGATEECNAFFETLAAKRRKDWRTWVLLPLYRMWALWVNFGPNEMHGTPKFIGVGSGLLRALLRAWVWGFSAVLALGFFVSMKALVSPRTGAFVLAGALWTKGMGELLVGLAVASPLSEIRYQVPVHPLGVVLAVVGVFTVVRLVGRRAAPQSD